MSARPIVPVADVEAEEAVLGALLRAGAAERLDVVERVRASGLVPEHFTSTRRAETLRRIFSLADRGIAPEVRAVSDGNEDRRAFLAGLYEVASAFGNAGHFASRVVDAASRREHQRALLAGLDAVDRGDLVDVVAPPMSRSGLVPLDLGVELAGPRPEPDWILGRRIARGDLVLLYGEAGVGKSQLTLGLAAALRTGGELLGERVDRGTVGIFDFEMPRDLALDRLLAFGLTADDHDGIVYFHAPLVDLGAGTAPVAAAVDEHALDVVVIDSFRRAAPDVDENDSRGVARFFDGLLRLSRAKGTTVIVVHHARKENGGGSRAMARGSGDMVAAVDSALYLRSTGESSFDLVHAKARRGLPAETVNVAIEGDEETGAIRLVPGTDGTLAADETAKFDELVAHLRDHPGEGVETIARNLRRNRPDTASRLRRLEEAGTAYRSPVEYTDGLGRRRSRDGWFAASEAASYPVRDGETGKDGEAVGPVPRSPSAPYRADGETGSEQEANGEPPLPPPLGRPGFIAYAEQACRTRDELAEALGLHAEAAAAAGLSDEAEHALGRLDELLRSRARERTSTEETS